MSNLQPIIVTPALSNAFRALSLGCAFLVILIHVPVDRTVASGQWMARIFSGGICGIAVPFFFFTAGFFLAGQMKGPGWWRREVVKRCRSLLLPYFIFCALYVGLVCCVIAVDNRSFNLSRTQAENFAFVLNPLNAFGLMPFDRPVFASLWFVRALFLLVLLSPAIAWCVRSGARLSVLCCLCLLMPYLVKILGCPKGVANIFGFGMLSTRGIFFFSIGVFLRAREFPLSVLSKNKWPAIVLGLAFLAIGGYLPKSGWCSMLNQVICWTGDLLSFTGLLTLLTEREVSLNSVLAACAFPIYLLHRFLLVPLKYVCLLLTGSTRPNGWGYLVMSLVLCCLTLGCVLGTRKFCPKVASLVFGGR